VKASQPTLATLPQAVFALQQEVTQALPKGLVEEAHRALGEQRTAACRRCGQTVSAGGPQERTVTTRVGAIQLRRPECSGPPGQLGSAPRDAALELTERCKPPDVPQAAGQLSQDLPYETACELVVELTGLPLSAHTAGRRSSRR
jgi:hypothetical protein